MRNLLLSTSVVSAILLAPLSGAAWTGPGGTCATDHDCGGICGWVCSVPRGNICVPAMGGDPGHCSSDGDCACPGQTCSGSVCTPAAQPECACNSDCPGDQICDQYLFTCHAQSAVSCGSPYDGYYFGPVSTGPSCGCDYTCAGGSAAPYCQPGTWIPPECSSDMDCGACHQGSICVLGLAPGGYGLCTDPDAGWCHGARDVASQNLGTTTGSSGGSTTTGSSGSATAGSSTGTSGGEAAGSSGGTSGGSETLGSPSRSGCSSLTGAPGAIGLLGAALLAAYRRRRSA